MPERPRPSAGGVYLALCAASSFGFWLVFGMNLLYQTAVVGLDPLQLVLVGTTLEATAFVFEIPTGVVADLVSRKLSIITGYVLIGAGFVLEGSIPAFGAVLAAQVLWGVGYTFTSGATQAWLADEVGEERAAPLFARGAQVGQIGALAGIAASTALGSVSIPLPVVCGGLSLAALAGALALAMPESRRPRPRADAPLRAFVATVRRAAELARGSRTIRLLLLLVLCYGLASEGLDRLWTARLLQDFSVIAESRWPPALWFGAAAAAFKLLGIASTAVALRVAARGSARASAAFLTGAFGAVLGLAVLFALTGWFWTAVAAFALIAAIRAAIDPLYDGLMNAAIADSSVRATLFSASSQANAVGQITGGPLSGLAGRLWSVRAGLLASAILLLPAPGAAALCWDGQ